MIDSSHFFHSFCLTPDGRRSRLSRSVFSTAASSIVPGSRSPRAMSFCCFAWGASPLPASRGTWPCCTWRPRLSRPTFRVRSLMWPETTWLHDKVRFLAMRFPNKLPFYANYGGQRDSDTHMVLATNYSCHSISAQANRQIPLRSHGTVEIYSPLNLSKIGWPKLQNTSHSNCWSMIGKDY